MQNGRLDVKGGVTMSGDEIHVCVDRVLPAELQVEAAARAIAENPANARDVSFLPSPGALPLPPSFLALLTGKLWANGRTLRVRFLDGDPVVQQRIPPFAHEWSKYANITFAFGNDPDAEIRISFQDSGSWSYLGTDALSIPRDQPTMNYGWLRADTPDEEYSRVVTHEFGHALACIHEHQSPAADIPWDKDAVYRYYMGPPNNWTKAEVDANLFERYSRTITQFSAFDRESIMLYAIPNQFTVGDYEVGWNTHLSPVDKSYIATIYPKVVKPTVELTVDARATNATIGAHGEMDHYRCAIAAAGVYTIQTGGPTDVFLQLYGPNNDTTLIAEDDDSGLWLNAKIVANLGPGTYFVNVRHYRPTGTGRYTIAIKSGRR